MLQPAPAAPGAFPWGTGQPTGGWRSASPREGRTRERGTACIGGLARAHASSGPPALPVGIYAVGTTLDTLLLGAQARAGQGARTSSTSKPHTIVPGCEKEPGRLLLTGSSDGRQASYRPGHPSPSPRATPGRPLWPMHSPDSMSSPSLNPFSGNAEGTLMSLHHRPQCSDMSHSPRAAMTRPH